MQKTKTVCDECPNALIRQYKDNESHSVIKSVFCLLTHEDIQCDYITCTGTKKESASSAIEKITKLAE